jgi:hypothetical protein
MKPLAEFHSCGGSPARSLILTGIKMWWAAGKEPNLDDNLRSLLRKVLPVTKKLRRRKVPKTVREQQETARHVYGDLPDCADDVIFVTRPRYFATNMTIHC